MTLPQNTQQDLEISTEQRDIDIPRFEAALLEHIETLGLPSNNVFVSVPQRLTVFNNAPAVIALISEQVRPQSVYFSKFLAATATGLFDAALNYLWDQTIIELRHRISQYDLSYFYDIVITDPNKRGSFVDEEDLVKITDHDLVRGARDIELISEIGYKHLDYIRYMRNWASAAHPNHNQITGLQLISWLETCIKEVINLPLSTVVVEIKRLLANIKTNHITPEEAKSIAVFFADLTQDRVNILCSGFFGIYTQPSTTTTTRQNIQHLLPHLWDRVGEATRQELGVKYAQFLARNEQQQQTLARQFLESVSALSYMPEGVLAAEVDTAIDNLLLAHRGSNNFYNEPAFANQLQRIVGETGKIPEQVNRKYVLALVEVFLSNGHGIAWNAEPHYIVMIEQFNARQILIAILSFMNEEIASKLQFQLCQNKFEALLEMMKQRTPTPAVKEFIDFIENHPAPLHDLRSVSEVKRRVDNLRRIL